MPIPGEAAYDSATRTRIRNYLGMTGDVIPGEDQPTAALPLHRSPTPAARRLSARRTARCMRAATGAMDLTEKIGSA